MAQMEVLGERRCCSQQIYTDKILLLLLLVFGQTAQGMSIIFLINISDVSSQNVGVKSINMYENTSCIFTFLTCWNLSWVLSLSCLSASCVLVNVMLNGQSSKLKSHTDLQITSSSIRKFLYGNNSFTSFHEFREMGFPRVLQQL